MEDTYNRANVRLGSRIDFDLVHMLEDVSLRKLGLLGGGGVYGAIQLALHLPPGLRVGDDVDGLAMHDCQRRLTVDGLDDHWPYLLLDKGQPLDHHLLRGLAVKVISVVLAPVLNRRLPQRQLRHLIAHEVHHAGHCLLAGLLRRFHELPLHKPLLRHGHQLCVLGQTAHEGQGVLKLQLLLDRVRHLQEEVEVQVAVVPVVLEELIGAPAPEHVVLAGHAPPDAGAPCAVGRARHPAEGGRVAPLRVVPLAWSVVVPDVDAEGLVELLVEAPAVLGFCQQHVLAVEPGDEQLVARSAGQKRVLCER
mmetsp:Transcript_26168/g.59577  ORF Transcript_26168/g.59577 Transcript_26168/m.59577 type:complete len:307 (-) Transcript_26168:224-1144(-)